MGTLACSSTTPPLSGPACPLPRGQWPHKTYLSPLLKPGDLEDYAAAGLLAYRVSDSGSIDVLLGRQNARGKGPSRRGTWSFIGGKREECESCSMASFAWWTTSLTPSAGSPSSLAMSSRKVAPSTPCFLSASL